MGFIEETYYAAFMDGFTRCVR